MSQFRKSGNYYVSQWNGDDVNAGTDPILPKKTLANLISSLPTTFTGAIIGSGVYSATVPNGTRTFIGDGLVMFETVNFGAVGTATLDNVYARGGTSPAVLNGSFSIYENGNFQIRGTKIGFLVIGNCQIVSGSTGTNRNCIFAMPSTAPNPTNAHLGTFEFNFIAKNTKFRLNSTTGGTNNNMINGLVSFNGVDYYESKRLIDGSTRPDATPGIPDILDIFPTFYSQGNFSGDPKFIDVISRTVEPDSDLLRKSNANGFIGGVRPGQYINFQNSDFLITFQNIDTSNPDLLRIATGFDFGKIRITGKVSDTLISSQAVDIRIPFFFDSSEPGGDPLNNNVPDAMHGLRGLDTLGDLPYRLRFEVRSSQMPNASRFNNDEWDNDISGIAGRWYLMEYGQPMLHHIVASVAYGNADKFAISAPIKVPFNYRSLDIEITLSNNRSQI